MEKIDAEFAVLQEHESQQPTTQTGMISGRMRQYLAAISVSFGAVCAGSALGWTSPAFAMLASGNASEPFIEMDGHDMAMVGAALPTGALIAALPAGYLAAKVGRKPVLLFIGLLFLFNWLLILVSNSGAMLAIARLIAGAATGAVCVTAPVYICEIAEAPLRGVLTSLFQTFLCLGILAACGLGLCLSWTTLCTVLALIPVVFVIAFVFMPESPAFMMQRGNIRRARFTLERLRDSNVTEELRAMHKELQFGSVPNRQRTAVSQLCARQPHKLLSGNQRAIVSALGVLAFQQLSGINAMVFYTYPIFEAAGVAESVSSGAASVSIAAVQVAISIVSMLVIEHADRKLYLGVSSTGMMLFLLLLGVFFHLGETGFPIDDYQPYTGVLTTMCVILYTASFSIGYGPIPFLLVGELFGPEIKGVASGLAILTNWSFAFIVTFFFPSVIQLWSVHTAFYGFATLMAIATVYVQLIVPETRGRTLPEIQQMLNN